MQEDLEVTGVSRSGRVRKKSSKLMDFESPDDIETRFRRQTPVKTYSTAKHDEPMEYQEQTPQRPVDEAGTASGSESDYYENNADNGESMESDSSVSDEGSARTPANSLYMMEKSKKKVIVKDGRVVGRAKAQRKDKGALDLLLQLFFNTRCVKRCVVMLIMIPGVRPPPNQGPGRPSSGRAPPRAAPTTPPHQALVPVSGSSSANAGVYRMSGCGAAEVAAHLRLLGESLAIIGERLKEHEGQIAVSGSVSVLLDTLLCSLAPLLAVARAVPAIAPPPALMRDTLHNIAYIMPGL
ncbi:uncharacterized protein LOC123668145 [Melitaea cinxia]|uniref:uncharacterized protein LOC123668145 n=1 Tax=Melitaea cinxia TaxID=113334 RepID=UPI001E2710E4|nr:uncharacterized protein LOC123668145 [Melitaea cinxia]